MGDQFSLACLVTSYQLNLNSSYYRDSSFLKWFRTSFCIVTYEMAITRTLASPHVHVHLVLSVLHLSLQEPHWLPIKLRIAYKLNLIIFKALHEPSPVYISDLLHKYIPVRPLRSAGQSLLTFSTKFYGQRAFHFIAPSLWNDLPLHIRQA